MANGQSVKNIMLVLSEYAVVPLDATLRDALLALQDAQSKVPEGRHPHRAVLVKDGKGRIVGKLGHLAFLRALVSEQVAFCDREILERAGVSADMQSASEHMFDLLGEDLFDLSERVRSVRIRDAYWAMNASVEENESYYDAIKAFLKHQTLSLLVTRKGETIGVLRLCDLFDELAKQAVEHE